MSLRLALELALTDNASHGLKSLADQLEAIGVEGAAAAKALNAGFAEFEAGRRAAAKAVDLAQYLRPGVEAAADLQDALATLTIELDASGAEDTLAALKKDAARIAGPTKFSLGEMLGISTDLKKAGLSMKDIIGQGGAAEATAQLATAEGGMDAQTAGALMTTLGAIWQKQGAEYSQMADDLIRGSASGTTSAVELGAALSNATAAGVMDSRDTIAALAMVSNTGLTGSAAGTALQAYMVQGAANPKNKDLGLFDEAGNWKSFKEQAAALRELTKNMNEQQKTQFFSQHFLEQGSQFAARLAAGDLDKTTADMGMAQGLAQRVEILGGTLNARTDALMGTLETTAATLFTPMMDPLSKLAEMAGDLANNFNELLEASPGLAKATSRLAGTAVVGLGLYGASRMVTGAGGIAGGLKAILGGKGGLIGGLAAGKLAEAAGAQPVFVTNWPETLGQSTQGLKDSIQQLKNSVSGGAGLPMGGMATSKGGKIIQGVAAVGAAWEIGTAVGEVGADVLAAKGAKGDGSMTWMQQLVAKGVLAKDSVGDAIMGRKDEYVTINGKRRLRSEVEQFAATGQLPGAQKPAAVDVTVKVEDGRATATVNVDGALTREASRG